MSRLTITLPDDRYLALKDASARRGKTIGQIIEESLEFYGIKSRESAQALVRRARARSALAPAQALDAAQQEVSAVRRSKSKAKAA